MFLDEKSFIHRDLLLSKQDVFLSEYDSIVNFFQYPEQIHNGKWETSPIYRQGKWYNNHTCQETLEILKSLDFLSLAVYSLFRSEAVVFPHVGFQLKVPVYRVHLPLIVPQPAKEGSIVLEEDCWIRVGNETRLWEKNKLLVFDDRVEHETQNNTSGDRLVLLMDFTKEAFSSANISSENAKSFGRA